MVDVPYNETKPNYHKPQFDQEIDKTLITEAASNT